MLPWYQVCSAWRVILYDLLDDGYHSPLTREQISELFHAGRIKKDDPCKAAAASSWRTVDEIFPLLKYGGPTLPHEKPELVALSPLLLAGIVAFAVTCLIALFLRVTLRSHGPDIATVDTPHQTHVPRNLRANISAPAFVYSMQPTSARLGGNPTLSSNVAPATVSPQVMISAAQTDSTQSEYDRIERERKRLEQERLAREQTQREQAALAERMRAENEQRQANAQRAAGQDTIFERERDGVVNVGGETVNLRLHDNDVTSIDYRLNYRWYRDVKKEKGITGSRTDETLLYGNGRASLYYVWELSGQLNHCRLRVRDN